MKIYCVIEAINQTMSPSIETSYHLTLDKGLKDFSIRVSSVGDDFVSIYLEELDTESMNVVILDSFEGNWESFEEDEEEEDEESDDE